MFKVFFTNFCYGLDKHFLSLDLALKAAQSHGFQCVIISDTGRVVGSWCPVGGFKQIKECV